MAEGPENKGLIRSRRDFPHWRIEGSTYFVTWHLAFQQPELAPAEKDLIARSLRHFHREQYRLYCYAVMPDHVHLIVRPELSHTLSKIIHSWKSFTAHEMVKSFSRTAPVWLSESLDRILRSDEELLEKAEYILTNPHRRWGDIEEYPWAEWLRVG